MRPTDYRGLVLLAGIALAVPGRFHFTYGFFFSLTGLFVVSLVSNATPFFGASYTLIATTELISYGFSVEAFTLIVGITAIGAALGKVVIYGSARVFKRQLAGNKNVQLLDQWLEHRRFLVAVFVAAVVPLLPVDDYIFIGAGGSKGRILPMMTVTVAAKIVKSAVEIALEFFGIINVAYITRHVLGLSSFEFAVILSAVMVVLGIFIFKYDWGRLLNWPATLQGV
ncbi:MAG: hypothetical protein JRM80_04365 [Nitrososphaerota archaeon]|nr:hypothetical protein [Nitrososphaerota archaeon]